MVTRKQSVPRCTGLAESGWPGYNRLDVVVALVISGWKDGTQTVSRCTDPGVVGLGKGDCGSSSHD